MADRVRLIAAQRETARLWGAGRVVGVAAAVYFTYMFWRNRRISHDAQLAEKWCPSQVAAFAKCHQGVNPEACRSQLLLLHDCVYRQKSWGDTDWDLL